MAEVLSRNLVSLTNSSRIKGLKPTSQCPLQVIQQFVDETFLYKISSIHEAREWKDTLNHCALISGQCINYQKSKVYFFNIIASLREKVTNILGCQEASLPNTYLGLPLTIKEVPNQYWNGLVERFQWKLVG